MKKTVLIVFFNILFLILVFFCAEILTYKYQAKIFYDSHPKIYPINKYSYDIYYPDYITDLKNHFNGANNLYQGRKPDGSEYKRKTPITLFGCSFAFGQHLNDNQTLSYKLAQELKRPVFNRAIAGGSFQHMYLQVINDSFYEDIPFSDTVIYVMIDDHYRREMLNYFDVLNLHIHPHFLRKNNELVMEDYDNKFMNAIRSSYIVKTINHVYADKYIKNPKNAEKVTDTALLYFIESRNELKKQWKNDIKFIVILYDCWEIPYKDLLCKKLKENGFSVYSVKSFTDENLMQEKYMMQDNYHPTEAAWDLLVPSFIEKLELK